jgi:VWFA-related protein
VVISRTKRICRRRVLAVLAAGPALSRAFAIPQAEFSAGVKVVSLLVTVRDGNAKFVNDLIQDDFVVEEDGQPQTISYFSRQNDLPLTLGLLVDTSQSQKAVLRAELAASATFFQQVLRENMDQAFLTRFDERASLVQNITGSRAKLEVALGGMEAQVRGNPSIQGTLLYDAIADSADLILKRLRGRKALILLTDGEDMGSAHTLDTAIASCQRADTVAYSIGIGTNLARGRSALQTISRRSGGEYLEVSANRPVELIYEAIEEELRSQYSIGYVPPQGASGTRRNGFHAVRVTVKRSGAEALTRDGYYAE